jgi:hypothetical protein
MKVFYIFLCIYLMLNLDPCYKFLFLNFFWDIYFFCATSSSVYKQFVPFSKDHLNVTREVHLQVNMSSVDMPLHHGCFVHLEMLDDQKTTSKPLSSALLSACLSKSTKIRHFFLGC